MSAMYVIIRVRTIAGIHCVKRTAHCVLNGAFGDDETIVFITYKVTDGRLIVLKLNANRLRRRRT